MAIFDELCGACSCPFSALELFATPVFRVPFVALGASNFSRGAFADFSPFNFVNFALVLRNDGRLSSPIEGKRAIRFLPARTLMSFLVVSSGCSEHTSGTFYIALVHLEYLLERAHGDNVLAKPLDRNSK